MKKTCRGCNNELDSCTCNVLTTDRPESLEAKVLRDEIKNLRLINESHRIENGKLQERITELEELMPTKEESMWLLDRIGIAKYFIVNHSVTAKLQKIIGE